LKVLVYFQSKENAISLQNKMRHSVMELDRAHK